MIITADSVIPMKTVGALDPTVIGTPSRKHVTRLMPRLTPWAVQITSRVKLDTDCSLPTDSCPCFVSSRAFVWSTSFTVNYIALYKGDQHVGKDIKI